VELSPEEYNILDPEYLEDIYWSDDDDDIMPLLLFDNEDEGFFEDGDGDMEVDRIMEELLD